MRTLIITITTALSTFGFAQSNYEAKMNDALQLWKKDNQSAISAFKEIDNEFKTQRLPPYYLALTQTLASFDLNDPIQREELIEESKTIIDRLFKDYPKDPEILNLKVLNLTAEIALNPMKNGMLLMDEVQSLYAQSLLLNPNNPRTILGKAEFNLHVAKFIGGDVTNDCKALQKAVALFATEQKDKLEPRWGKEHAEEVLKVECKN